MENRKTLLAGFARLDISPRKPCFLVGYPHVERTSTGIHDPLFASAVCLEHRGETVIVVSVDLIFVTAEWTRDCRARISAQTGVYPEAILIAATHTHSGPHVADILAWRDDPVVPPVDVSYTRLACAETAAAAIDAWKGRHPAEAAWVTADVRGLAGGNRIDPDGLEDPQAGLLFVRSQDNHAPLAVLSIYGMHPTVLHEDSKLVSSDFIAFTRRCIEDAFPGAGVVYLNGVCGNQSPRRVVRAQTFGEAERIGSALGLRMAEALRSATGFTADFPIRARVESIELSGKMFPPVAEAAENLSVARKRLDDLRLNGADRAMVRTAECTVFGAEEVLTLAKAEFRGHAEAIRKKYGRADVQVLRLGPAFVAGWPGEFFVEYGLEVKNRSHAMVFVSTMCNGELQGYIVTPDAEAARGYEAQMSLFPASAGTQFVEATLKLVGDLS